MKKDTTKPALRSVAEVERLFFPDRAKKQPGAAVPKPEQGTGLVYDFGTRTSKQTPHRHQTKAASR
jgi:hypothetical protein